MKLKTNKIFIKGSRIKTRNQNNNDWIWNIRNKENKTVIFFLRGGGAIKGKKYLIGDKLTTQYWHELSQKVKDTTTL